MTDRLSQLVPSISDLSAMSEEERRAAADPFARGCWCSEKGHTGWCDGKHHQRMRECPHENIQTSEHGEEFCADCRWFFTIRCTVNGVPSLTGRSTP